MMLRLLLAFGGALAAASAAPAPVTPAIAPTAPLALFDGRDLAAFDTWLVDAHRADPLRVFSVVDQIDGQPAIRISGEQWGGLVTKRRFRDYRLTFEFRWGAIIWGTRRNSARDSGVLLHCQGEFGNHTDDFNAPWMRSVEFQIIEGGTGDIILVGGFDTKGGPRLTPAVSATTAGKTRLFQPDGALSVSPMAASSGGAAIRSGPIHSASAVRAMWSAPSVPGIRSRSRAAAATSRST
jgi:hypothetical protein